MINLSIILDEALVNQEAVDEYYTNSSGIRNDNNGVSNLFEENRLIIVILIIVIIILITCLLINKAKNKQRG